MRATTALLFAFSLAACGSDRMTDRVAPDASADSGHDASTADGGTDAGSDGSAPDLGALDLGALDLGAPDLGAPDLGTPDLGAPDLGAPDLGAPDLGAPDTGVAAGFVLGAPGDNCDMTCGYSGRSCAGRGSVGLDCLVHTDIATCTDPANWIYRFNPGTKPEPYCRADWGTSEVCSNNYNGSNSFCCRCL